MDDPQAVMMEELGRALEFLPAKPFQRAYQRRCEAEGIEDVHWSTVGRWANPQRPGRPHPLHYNLLAEAANGLGLNPPMPILALGEPPTARLQRLSAVA